MALEREFINYVKSYCAEKELKHNISRIIILLERCGIGVSVNTILAAMAYELMDEGRERLRDKVKELASENLLKILDIDELVDEAIRNAIVKEGCMEMVRSRVIRTIMEDEFLRKNILENLISRL